MRKVFCIGANKTGTTSIELLFRKLGLKVAPQRPAELMLEAWGRRDFSGLIEFCQEHEAFQDIPFSLPFTSQALDQSFPGSKFILTVRTDSDQWYESLIRYERQFMELDRLPVAQDLKENPYLYEGWFWRSHELIWGVDENTLYEPGRYKAQYEAHNEAIGDYFRERPEDLLVLNVAEPDAVERICDFLSMERLPLAMPHLN